MNAKLEPSPRRELPGGAWLLHDAAFLTSAEADRLLEALVAELRWEQRAISLFGRRVLQPRLIAWAGALGYRYSGQTLEPRSFSPAARELLLRVADRTRTEFNHVLFNRYRHGDDSMGMHADDEPELGRDPLLASVSFGAPRRFVIVSKRRSEAFRHELELGHGALLIMGGSFQHHFRHGVPKQAAVRDERVSATFRRLLSEPGAASETIPC